MLPYIFTNKFNVGISRECALLCTQILKIFIFLTDCHSGEPGCYAAIMIFNVCSNFNQGVLYPLKPKIESCFSTFSLDCFNRCMTQVFLFYIDLTSKVAMVTENGRQYRLK